MKKVIINADDFGLTMGCSRGIIEAMGKGIVTSTTIMTNMPKAVEAACLARENGIRRAGVHLVLNSGKPLSPPEEVSSIVNKDGVFHRDPGQMFPAMKLDEVEKEFRRQVERFFETGLALSHFDSHQHIHTHDGIRRIILALAKEYDIPVRQFDEKVKTDIKENGIKTTDWFCGAFYKERAGIESLKDIMLRAPEGILEIMTHPGYSDKELMDCSSYNVERERELAILTDGGLKSWIREQGIELAGYDSLK